MLETILQSVIQSSLSDDDKVTEFSRLLSSNFGSIISNNFNEYEIIVDLFKIEILLGSDVIHSNIGDLFKGIQSSNYFSEITSYEQDEYLQTYVRVKFNDLHNDYQYLLKDRNCKIFDLINKKILLVNSIPKRFKDILDSVNLKILELLIVSNYSFRKSNIVNYLKGNLDFTKVNPQSKEIFEMILNNRLIPLNVYHNFLNHIQHAVAIKRINYESIISNALENNIYNLTKYYKAIKITKINKLLGIDKNREIESIITKMIIGHELPSHTKIDQINNLLIFGNNSSNDELDNFNEHIKEVSELIDEIHTSIIAGQ